MRARMPPSSLVAAVCLGLPPGAAFCPCALVAGGLPWAFVLGSWLPAADGQALGAAPGRPCLGALTAAP